MKDYNFQWPITRERYEQVLAAKSRQWQRIQELEALLDGTEAKEIHDRMILRIAELEAKLELFNIAYENAKVKR